MTESHYSKFEVGFEFQKSQCRLASGPEEADDEGPSSTSLGVSGATGAAAAAAAAGGGGEVAAAKARGKLVGALVRRHLIEGVVPLLVELRHMMQVGAYVLL